MRELLILLAVGLVMMVVVGITAVIVAVTVAD